MEFVASCWLLTSFHFCILRGDFQSVYFMRARLMKALEVCGAAVGTAKHH